MKLYSAETPEALRLRGLEPNSSAPEDLIHSHGCRVDQAQYHGDDRPEYHAKIIDKAGSVRGDGWGDTIRLAFLAAVEEYVEGAPPEPQQ